VQKLVIIAQASPKRGEEENRVEINGRKVPNRPGILGISRAWLQC